MIMRTAWIPEAPKFPGLYANESDRSRDGKISTGVLQPSTYNPHRAKQFASEAECQAWCDANPHPVFVPREHGFYE